MLTRLEVDGFKNLLGFAVDLGPFNCIAGPNGVGKSNVFDAIRFLSDLAEGTLHDAALKVRGTGASTGDLRDLFWTDGEQTVDRLRMAAEMLVEPEVVDDFGRPARASSTFLRYEIELGYEAPERAGMLGRLELKAEHLGYITEGDAAGRLRFPHSAGQFRNPIVVNKRRVRAGYVSTHRTADGQTEILVHQDGKGGLYQRAAAHDAPRTVIATANTSATPTLLAVRREMQRWRLLALEPSAMRSSDSFSADAWLGADGRHLPATLHRLAAAQGAAGNGGGEQVYARVAARLAELVGVRQLRVQVDDVRQLLTLMARETSGLWLPARSLSDGTLRFLALCVLLEDPSARGLLCMEEPENGIHPAKMESMVELLRDLAVDPHQAPGLDNPLRQVIVATHSPAFVQLQHAADLLVAREVTIRGPFERPVRVLRCIPLEGSWRTDDRERGVGKGSLLNYLTMPPGAQLTLPGLEPA